MGVQVTLVRGEVRIPATRHADALAAVRALDEHDEPKTGGAREVRPDGSVAGRPHWAFVDGRALRAATSLPEALATFRFVPVLDPDGDLLGVELEGGTRSAGDEAHLWAALAPFVEPGGELIWVVEDGSLLRWSFDGDRLTTSVGRMVFE